MRRGEREREKRKRGKGESARECGGEKNVEQAYDSVAAGARDLRRTDLRALTALRFRAWRQARRLRRRAAAAERLVNAAARFAGPSGAAHTFYRLRTAGLPATGRRTPGTFISTPTHFLFRCEPPTRKEGKRSRVCVLVLGCCERLLFVFRRRVFCAARTTACYGRCMFPTSLLLPPRYAFALAYADCPAPYLDGFSGLRRHLPSSKQCRGAVAVPGAQRRYFSPVPHVPPPDLTCKRSLAVPGAFVPAALLVSQHRLNGSTLVPRHAGCSRPPFCML
jgi:hypothetical protein